MLNAGLMIRTPLKYNDFLLGCTLPDNLYTSYPVLFTLQSPYTVFGPKPPVKPTIYASPAIVCKSCIRVHEEAFLVAVWSLRTFPFCKAVATGGQALNPL